MIVTTVLKNMQAEEDSDDEQLLNVFATEEEFSNEAVHLKFDTYQLPDGRKEMSLALLDKHHSLWAEYIYNAARLLADLLLKVTSVGSLHGIDVNGLKVLELGAGAGLPSIVSAILGAKEVIISDYGQDFDLSLIYPIDVNIEMFYRQLLTEKHSTTTSIHAVAYTWGNPVSCLTEPSKYYQRANSVLDLSSFDAYVRSKIAARIKVSEEEAVPSEVCDDEKLDVILLADLLFNRSEHRRLLWTVKRCLRQGNGFCYVAFSHHDPQKSQLDLNFFELAKEEEYGFHVEYIGSQQRRSYPFVESDGMDYARGEVHLYTLQLLT